MELLKLLAYIGGLSIFVGLGWIWHWLSSQIKLKNPIKSYIQKIVMEYLKDLQND